MQLILHAVLTNRFHTTWGSSAWDTRLVFGLIQQRRNILRGQDWPPSPGRPINDVSTRECMHLELAQYTSTTPPRSQTRRSKQEIALMQLSVKSRYFVQ